MERVTPKRKSERAARAGDEIYRKLTFSGSDQIQNHIFNACRVLTSKWAISEMRDDLITYYIAQLAVKTFMHSNFQIEGQETSSLIQ